MLHNVSLQGQLSHLISRTCIACCKNDAIQNLALSTLYSRVISVRRTVSARTGKTTWKIIVFELCRCYGKRAIRLPGKGFDKCFSSNEGFSKNSNHSIVSGEIGTVPGLSRSTSMLKVSSLMCAQSTDHSSRSVTTPGGHVAAVNRRRAVEIHESRRADEDWPLAIRRCASAGCADWLSDGEFPKLPRVMRGSLGRLGKNPSKLVAANLSTNLPSERFKSPRSGNVLKYSARRRNNAIFRR